MSVILVSVTKSGVYIQDSVLNIFHPNYFAISGASYFNCSFYKVYHNFAIVKYMT